MIPYFQALFIQRHGTYDFRAYDIRPENQTVKKEDG